MMQVRSEVTPGIRLQGKPLGVRQMTAPARSLPSVAAVVQQHVYEIYDPIAYLAQLAPNLQLPRASQIILHECTLVFRVSAPDRCGEATWSDLPKMSRHLVTGYGDDDRIRNRRLSYSIQLQDSTFVAAAASG